MKYALPFLCATALACGGALADDDGGSDSGDASAVGDSPVIGLDAKPPVDAGTTTCGSAMMANEETDASCQLAYTYACGATKYDIECSCPAATCTCSMQSPNVSSVASVPAGSVCPACSFTPDDVGTLCGFPH